MKPGMGHRKGSKFERDCAKQLSLWMSSGKRDDYLWRTSLSGGRATLLGKRGKLAPAQEGDLGAIDPAGHNLTSAYIIECKHVRSLGLDSFMLKAKGPLSKFWSKLLKQASLARKQPMLIARQNGYPTIMMVAMATRIDSGTSPIAVLARANAVIYLFDEVMKAPFPAEANVVSRAANRMKLVRPV
jgi:hypothetical protein